MAPRISNDLIKFLKRKNLKGMILLSNRFAPRLIGGLLPKLSDKQRKAFDKVMPKDGQKKIFFQLVGTPTPPIVVKLAQPLLIEVLSEEEVSRQGIKGIRIQVDDLPILVESASGGDIFKALKGLKGQTGAVMSLMGTFSPLVTLGPAELKDMQKRAMAHFKPFMDLLPH